MPAPLLVALLCCVHIDSAIDVSDVERRVIDNRRNLNTMHASLTIEEELSKHNQPAQSKHMEIWQDGDKYRADSVPMGDKHSLGHPNRRHVLCLNCDQGNRLTFVEGRRAVVIQQVDPTKPELLGMGRFDLRLLGMSTLTHAALTGLDPRAPIDIQVRSPELSPRKATRELLDGHECVVLRCAILRTKASHTVWVRPDQGYSIVRIETVLTTPAGQVYRNLMTADIDTIGGGVWYPKRCSVDIFEVDRVTVHEAITVHSVAANAPIDPAVFTLAGCQPTTGTTAIIEGPGAKMLTVRDGKLVPHEPPPSHLAGEMPQPAAVRTQWWLVVLVLLLAVVGVIMIRRAVARS